MKVVEIRDLLRKDIPIYYRREFFGSAVLEFLNQRHHKKIDFTVERTPMGTTNIQVSLMESIDYPVMPIIDCLKKHIRELDSQGNLP
jgi:hypothetical protein